ncbi:LysM peptidoglycan-binding domain-containing protein [Spirosoma knui]
MPTIKFAGVTIHLTDAEQIQLKQEVSKLYGNRNQLLREVATLRQLSALLQPRIREAGLPDDFRYVIMPFADVKPNTYWSVQESQVQTLRLLVNDEVDERYHPILVTEAVLPYLSRLRETQGNYVATLLRYFQTPTAPYTIAQKDPADIQLSPQVPSILWRVLARKLAIEHEEPTYRPIPAYLFFEYRKGGGQTLASIARNLKVDPDRITSVNKWLLDSTVPTDKDYSVLVLVTPDELPAVRLAADLNLPVTPDYQTDIGFPIVKKMPERESGLRSKAVLYTINERLGVQAQVCDNPVILAYYGRISIRQFLKYNELTEQDVVWPGQIYYLEPKAKRAKVPYHVMQRNQTLREVSNMYGVRLSYLLFFNDIAPTQRVQPGRIIWMRKKRPYRRPVEYLQLPTVDQPPILKRDSVVADSSLAILPQTQVKDSSIVAHQDSVQAAVITPDSARHDSIKVDSVQPVADTLVNYKEVSEPEPQPAERFRMHVVKPGQTYYAISRLYNVSVQQLYRWNNLSERIALRVGQELIIDTSKPVAVKPTPKPPGKVPVRPAKPKPVPNAPNVYYYTVKPGQTVYRVALINKVSIPNLMRWNNLTNYTITVGQRLLIRN